MKGNKILTNNYLCGGQDKIICLLMSIIYFPSYFMCMCLFF